MAYARTRRNLEPLAARAEWRRAYSTQSASYPRQNRRGRQIFPVEHMVFRPLTCKAWRPTPDLAGQKPHKAAVPRERKAWQAGLLQPSAVSSEHGDMALSTVDEAPNTAIFHGFFAVFRRVFPRAFPSERKMDAIQPRKALGRVQTGAIEAKPSWL
jgi:hypothetical protein